METGTPFPSSPKIANLFIMSFKVMKKIVLALFAVLLIPTDAFSYYTFSIKAVNKTDGDLYVYKLAYSHPKGRMGGSNECRVLDTELPIYNEDKGVYIVSDKGNIQYTCYAQSQKWQRSIMISFSCNNENSLREVRYPKSKKFYDRDYPAKNGDRYTILVKKKDC